MKVHCTPEDLVAFEEEVKELFLAKRIAAPVHLAGGNERQLIEIFERHVNEDDWVLGGWRSHYHALLKGVPRDEVLAAILAGRSISLSFPSHRFLCSGIVGGVAPIAVGLALGIKRKGEAGRRKVVVFLGDMSAETGITHESVKYARNHRLPVLWVVENNDKSVCTPTREVWGGTSGIGWYPDVIRYDYELTRPHVGVGSFVRF